MDRVITISGQAGSKTKKIAAILGQILGVPVYDKEIIKAAAQDSGIASEHFEKADERRTTSFLFSLVSAHYGPSTSIELPNIINDDNLFLHVSAAIKRLATGGCIVIGRCADEVLKELNPFRIFVCGDMDARVVEVAEREGISEKDALGIIKKTDKSRANYYNYYTGKSWGEPTNYDVVFNSSGLSDQQCAQRLSKFIE